MATLYLVATPIGNRDDITIRALKVLFTIPILVTEDTRVTGNLLSMYRNSPLLDALGIDKDKKPTLITCNDNNEATRVAQIVNYLQQGIDVALVSDAGTPVISDPGFKVIRAVVASGFKVVPIPGASAVTSALIASQLPPASFYYCGFLPNKQKARLKYLLELIELVSKSSKQCTVVAFESPYRIISALKDFETAYGPDFKLVVARELTKVHEQIESKSISEWLKIFEKYPPKGEFTLCFVPVRVQNVE